MTIYKESACPNCGTKFKYRSNKIYCSRICKHNFKFRPWRSYKKDHCERCGFIPEHQCQLDVDHIDGNKQNNHESNYQTLCANCHRLKTQSDKNYLTEYRKGSD